MKRVAEFLQFMADILTGEWVGYNPKEPRDVEVYVPPGEGFILVRKDGVDDYGPLLTYISKRYAVDVDNEPLLQAVLKHLHATLNPNHADRLAHLEAMVERQRDLLTEQRDTMREQRDIIQRQQDLNERLVAVLEDLTTHRPVQGLLQPQPVLVPPPCVSATVRLPKGMTAAMLPQGCPGWGEYSPALITCDLCKVNEDCKSVADHC